MRVATVLFSVKCCGKSLLRTEVKIAERASFHKTQTLNWWEGRKDDI